MPALFHIMSRPPPSLPAQKSDNALTRAALSVTSTARVHSRSAPSSPLRAARPYSFRSVAPTRQPLAWKSFTPSRPIPLPAPVMKTDFTTPQPPSSPVAGPVLGPLLHTSLMRLSVLVISRILRRFRRKPPRNQYAPSHGAGLS